MKLTAEQLNTLQDTLRDRITYRETYEEVYDHVLTALEQIDSKIPLSQAINTIMLTDFGGFAGLRLIERKRRWMIAKQMLNKQFLYFINYFKFPFLPITVIIYALIYYCVIDLKIDPQAWVIFMAMMALSLSFTGWRYFKAGWIFEDTQKSIKDKIFKIISYLPNYIYIIGNAIRLAFFRDIAVSGWFSLHPLVIIFLLTIYIIYTLSSFKLYNDEFTQLEIK